MHAVASIDSLFQGWVVTYGLLAILLLMTVQCIGVPFPSEVIMPVAGYLASTGRLNLVAVIVVGIVGNVVGSLIAYGLAAWLGEPVRDAVGQPLGDLALRQGRPALDAGRRHQMHGVPLAAEGAGGRRHIVGEDPVAAL